MRQLTCVNAAAGKFWRIIDLIVVDVVILCVLKMDREQFSELDQLIKNTEFENNVQDKVIYNERETITAYEREINRHNENIKIMEKEMTRNDELSLKYLHKIGQSRENYESLKKTSAVLDDHVEALSRKVEGAKQLAIERREEQRRAIEKYSLKWEEYKKRYESTELGQSYLAVCKEVGDLEKEFETLDKELEQARKALQKEDPIEKIKPWIVEFAEYGVMAGLLSADVKQLDNINESLLSEIDQLKREIDNTTAKIQEASTKLSNNSSNLVPAPPPPPPPAGSGDDQISTGKRPRLAPTIAVSWASKLKTISGGSSVHVNNPRPNPAVNNPGPKPDSGPPIVNNPRPLASVRKPIPALSNPLTSNLTTVSRPSVNFGSQLMTRPIMCPRPPSSIQNPSLISKPSSIETPPMTPRPLPLEIPPVVSKSNPIINNPSSIANNLSLLSRPLAIDAPISRPSTMEIPVSRPLAVELPMSRPLVSSSENEPEISMDTLEPVDSMETAQDQESGSNFYYDKMQLGGLPQEGEERMRVDQICDISVGGLGGGGGFVNDFFPEAATNTTSSGDFFPSMSGGDHSQSVRIGETADNFDIFSSAIGGQTGNKGGGNSGDGVFFFPPPTETTDTGMFNIFGGENNTNTSGW